LPTITDGLTLDQLRMLAVEERQRQLSIISNL
jgi:hypothetical protein